MANKRGHIDLKFFAPTRLLDPLLLIKPSKWILIGHKNAFRMLESASRGDLLWGGLLWGVSSGVSSGGSPLGGLLLGVSSRGGLLRGGSAPWGLVPGGLLPGVCSQGGSGPGGSAPGESAPGGMGGLVPGGYIPACTEAEPPPLWTDLGPTSLRPVKFSVFFLRYSSPDIEYL